MKATTCLFKLLSVLVLLPLPLRAEIIEAEVCVFGGTSGGIAAAVQASRLGRRAVIAEPGKFLGGLTTGGLGATDIGNKAAIGGLAREFYGHIAKHYAQDSAWKWESRADYFAKGIRPGRRRSDSLGQYTRTEIEGWWDERLSRKRKFLWARSRPRRNQRNCLESFQSLGDPI